MSYELDIREELIIQNVNGRTRAAAERLADYIRQFDRMDGLSGMQIYSMELEADGRIAYADDEISTKECGYIFTDDADGAPRVKLIEEDYSHWDDEEDVAVILAGLTDARKIILRMDCSLQVASETSYGVAYWQDFLQNMDTEGFGDNVNYRSAEFYTAEDPVCCYSYQNGRGTAHKFEAIGAGPGAAAGNDGTGAAAGNDGPGVAAGNDGIGAAAGNDGPGAAAGNDGTGAAAGCLIDTLNGQSWYSYCLNMTIDCSRAKGEEGSPYGDGVEFCRKMAELVDGFSARYDLETTWETMRMTAAEAMAEAGSVGKPDAGAVLTMTEELELMAGEAEDFMAELQKFCNLAAEYGAEFSLRGEFFADNGNFEFMSIGAEDGKVQAKYCKF